MRNLGLIVAFWLAAVLPTGSHALGLGEIEVSSFLNQPLKAEIEVISARPGEIDDLLVSLASREAFTRAGLARPRHLTDLRFSVNKSEEGDTAVILITTRDSVKEPFLNFLIEADWSKGRILREFTVFLDPPFYAEQPAPSETMTQDSMPASDDSSDMAEPEPEATGSDAVEQPVASSETITEPIALSESTSSESTPSEPKSGAQTSSPPSGDEYVADESQNIIEGDVLVVKGDTLWSIASRYKDEDHSMAQVMLAFQRSNPNAFGDGNINYLKVGSVLRAPSAYEMDAFDQQAAYAEMLTQNGLWDDYVARVTGVSPAMDGADEGMGESASENQGELSLLMPAGDGSDSTGTGDSAGLEQLSTKLALAEEELEASRIENADLESRIAELQARVSKFEELQKMIEIEDDSLALIQAGQTDDLVESSADGESEDNLSDDSAAAQSEAADAISDTMQADEDALLEELLAEEAAAQAEEQAALLADDMSDGESETTVSDELIEEPAEAAVDSGDQMTDDETESTTTVAPPAPVIITESASASGSMLDGILPPSVTDMIPSMDGIFGDPIILAAVGGVIVLLLILVIVKRRKAAQDDDSDSAIGGDDDLFGSDDEEELTPVHLTEVEVPVETGIKVRAEVDVAPDEQTEDEHPATLNVSAVDTSEPQEEAPAPAAAEQDDVANEVDVYLAYGLYDNAEDLLKTSLAESPDRGDYRSKLLDTYFATKNVNAFVEEAQNLKAMGDAAISYWDRVQIMGYELAPDNALFSDAKDSGLSAADLEIVKPQEADFDFGSDDEDSTGFSTTDFNLGEEEGGEDFSDTMQGGEIGNLESTQQLTPADDTSLDDFAASLDDVGEGNLDDIGEELEFSMDDDVALDFDMDEGLDGELDLDDALELEVPEDESLDYGKTEIITPNYEDTEITSSLDEIDADDAFDLGMDDAAMKGFDDPAEATGELVLDGSDADDDSEDVSIIDFGGDDFVEATELTQSLGDDDFLLDDDEDEELSTGTFAPGDFDEPTGSVQSIGDMDDIDDLMLPDDVDEVSTKLDLARAFIDMGDTEGARGSLEEVKSEGNAEQKAEAEVLLDQI